MLLHFKVLNEKQSTTIQDFLLQILKKEANWKVFRIFGQYNTKVITVESRATTTLTLIENIVCKIVRISCYACKEKKIYTFINTIKYTSFQIHLHFKSDIYRTYKVQISLFIL